MKQIVDTILKNNIFFLKFKFTQVFYNNFSSSVKRRANPDDYFEMPTLKKNGKLESMIEKLGSHTKSSQTFKIHSHFIISTLH